MEPCHPRREREGLAVIGCTHREVVSREFPKNSLLWIQTDNWVGEGSSYVGMRT